MPWRRFSLEPCSFLWTQNLIYTLFLALFKRFLFCNISCGVIFFSVFAVNIVYYYSLQKKTSNLILPGLMKYPGYLWRQYVTTSIQAIKTKRIAEKKFCKERAAAITSGHGLVQGRALGDLEKTLC